MIASKQKKPDKCRVPDREAETYCLNEEDMNNLIALMEEANGILDFYHHMPQNLTGILATALLDRHEALISLVESFRDDLYRVEFIGGGTGLMTTAEKLRIMRRVEQENDRRIAAFAAAERKTA